MVHISAAQCGLVGRFATYRQLRHRPCLSLASEVPREDSGDLRVAARLGLIEGSDAETISRLGTAAQVQEAEALVDSIDGSGLMERGPARHRCSHR